MTDQHKEQVTFNKQYMHSVMTLITDIKTLKCNSDYRVADIILKKGERWNHSGNEVLTKNDYNGSILQQYLKLNGLHAPANFYTLLHFIEKYNQEKTLPIPTNNEIVIHLRLGDVVNSKWYLTKNYIDLINKILTKDNNIDKITFVTCFAYQEWSTESLHLRKRAPLWNYTEEKQEKNIENTIRLFEDIKNHFPALELKVYSNENIDKDLCFCVLAKHFIYDGGGFSLLCHHLNLLRTEITEKNKILERSLQLPRAKRARRS